MNWSLILVLVLSIQNGQDSVPDDYAGVCESGQLEPPRVVYNPLPPGGYIHQICEKPVRAPVVRYEVTERGEVDHVFFLRDTNCAKADKILQRCLNSWVFEPAKCDGESVAVVRHFTVNWGHGEPPSMEDEDFCPPKDLSY